MRRDLDTTLGLVGFISVSGAAPITSSCSEDMLLRGCLRSDWCCGEATTGTLVKLLGSHQRCFKIGSIQAVTMQAAFTCFVQRLSASTRALESQVCRVCGCLVSSADWTLCSACAVHVRIARLCALHVRRRRCCFRVVSSVWRWEMAIARAGLDIETAVLLNNPSAQRWHRTHPDLCRLAAVSCGPVISDA